MLLSLIVLNYYKNYLNNANPRTFRIMLAFVFILVSYLFFTFIFLLPGLYVVGQLFLLTGFSLLLYTYHSIIRTKSRPRVEIIVDKSGDKNDEGKDNEIDTDNEMNTARREDKNEKKKRGKRMKAATQSY